MKLIVYQPEWFKLLVENMRILCSGSHHSILNYIESLSSMLIEPSDLTEDMILYHFRSYILKPGAKRYTECFGLPIDELVLCMPLNYWLSRFVLQTFIYGATESHPAISKLAIEQRNKLLYFYKDIVPKEPEIQRYYAKQGIRIALAFVAMYGQLPQEAFITMLHK